MHITIIDTGDPEEHADVMVSMDAREAQQIIMGDVKEFSRAFEVAAEELTG